LEEIEVKEPRTYEEVLNSCGQTTICKIRRGLNSTCWKKINIPYKCLKNYPGEYEPGLCYVARMKLYVFFGFLALHDNDLFATDDQEYA
jgi:hypothetical protein